MYDKIRSYYPKKLMKKETVKDMSECKVKSPFITLATGYTNTWCVHVSSKSIVKGRGGVILKYRWE